MKRLRIFPRWPVSDHPSDTRKWVALLVSFGGAVVFTAGAAMLVHIIWKGGWTAGTEGQRLEILGTALFMILGGAIAANLAFGFVITPRKYKVGKDGIEAEGGDQPQQTIKTETTVSTKGPSA